MKKTIILIIFLVFYIGSSNAQKFYARIGVGASAGTTSTLDMLYKYSYDGGNRTIRVVPVDLGSGMNGSVAFGFMPCKYVGFELAISKFIGFLSRGDSVMKMLGGVNSEATVKANVLSLIPSVVVSAGLEKVNPYGRFGIMIGVLPVMRQFYKSERTSVHPPNEVEATHEYTGGVAIGFNATGGVSFKVNNLISMFAELNFTGMSYSPTESDLIRYDINDVDQLPSLSTKQKETIYLKKINLDEQIPDTSPDKKLMKSYSLNSVGASFGIVFSF